MKNENEIEYDLGFDEALSIIKSGGAVRAKTNTGATHILFWNETIKRIFYIDSLGMVKQIDSSHMEEYVYSYYLEVTAEDIVKKLNPA